MIPILFPASATTFTSNGLGGLADAISCTVTEERNGSYTLEMEYPVTGVHYADIAVSTIVYAQLDPLRGKQGFRIYKITRPMNGRVKVFAEHVSYQLSHIPVAPFTASTVTAALDGLTTYAAEACPFTFSTDKATVATYTQTVPASIRSRLGGTQGSILDVYGGEYEFDNFDVHLWAARGADRGVVLRYGKNLVDLKQEENIANTITGVFPYWRNDQSYLQLPEKVVSSPTAANYPYPRTIPLDLSQSFSQEPTENELRAAATSYVSATGIGIPKVSIKLDFIALADTLEYADMAALERIGMCDILTVIYEELGVQTTAKVTKTTWDVLLERYVSAEVGDIKATLAQTIAQTQEEADSAVDSNVLLDAIASASSLITGVTGGHVVLNRDADGHPYELLIMDTDNIATAVHVWRFNQAGWGYSSTGYSGTYSLAATIDGGIVADYITAGTLTGLKINNGSGTFYVDSTGQVTAKSINITGGSVNIDGSSDDTQVIKLNYYRNGAIDVFNSFYPSGIEVNGGANWGHKIAKMSPGTFFASQIYYDGGGNSQLKSAFYEEDGISISDTGTGASANYNVPWYEKMEKVAGVGTITYGSGASVSMSNTAWTNLCSVAHGTGTYLIAAYYSVSSNTTGYRHLMVTSSATGSTPINTEARARVAPVNGAETSVAVFTAIKATSSGTWYLRAQQNSGSTLTASAAVIRIIKLCDN